MSEPLPLLCTLTIESLSDREPVESLVGRYLDTYVSGAAKSASARRKAFPPNPPPVMRAP